jgi:hypothetical protein
MDHQFPAAELMRANAGLAGVALVGALAFFFGMPETYVREPGKSGERRDKEPASASATALDPAAKSAIASD